MFLLIASIKTFAYDFAIDGICYRVSSEKDHECAVTGYKEITNNNLIIPASITWNNIKYSVVSIGGEAFEGCSGLTSITIPSSINRIGYGAFDKCENLNTAIIEQGGTDIILEKRSFYSIKKLIANRNIKTLRSYSNNYRKDSPFGEKLNTIEFGERFTRIDDYLFYGCSGLESVNIPSSVITIKENAFDNCENLNTAIIEQGGTDITLEDRCFYSIKKLIANRNIKTLRPYSNNNTKDSPFGEKLNIIEFGDRFTRIDDYLFYRCSGLTSINIPENVTSIGRGAFLGCSGLTSINIPKNVTSIREYTFSDCSSLTSIDIPEGVTAIESSAFCGCNSLNSISLPNSLKTIGDMEDRFQEGVFFGCSSLQTITIRKRIRDAAFFLIIMLVTFAATLLNPQKYVSSRTIQKCVEHVSTST